jgi:hypothetical protein
VLHIRKRTSVARLQRTFAHFMTSLGGFKAEVSIKWSNAAGGRLEGNRHLQRPRRTSGQDNYPRQPKTLSRRALPMRIPQNPSTVFHDLHASGLFGRSSPIKLASQNRIFMQHGSHRTKR